jgi:hypothetical protein
VGEESLVGLVGRRIGTATVMTACVALTIEREEMLRILHKEPYVIRPVSEIAIDPLYAKAG